MEAWQERVEGGRGSDKRSGKGRGWEVKTCHLVTCVWKPEGRGQRKYGWRAGRWGGEDMVYGGETVEGWKV